MNAEAAIKDLIQSALQELDIQVEDVFLEHPTELAHGDYSSNVAMMYAKEVGKNPRELAEEIVSILGKDKNIEKVEIAGPGFINFHLSKDFYKNKLEEIIKLGDKWGTNTSRKGMKVMVEYTDPNPFKVFHIGHLMSNAIGESIARLIEASSAEVRRASYQGDIGPHVAKTIWALKWKSDMLEMEPQTPDWYGHAYKIGAKVYEENEEAKVQINEVNKKLYEGNDQELNKLYEEGRKVSLDHFEEIYAVLGTKFDYYFFESETWRDGQEKVRENIGPVFIESEGAVIFKGDDYDKTLHTRVFINSEGLPTYEAKEIGLAYKKKDTEDADLSITITACEQTEYFRVVLKALELIDENIASRIKHLSHGMMKLSSGKMSSRTGDVVTGENLIENVKERSLQIMEERDIENKKEIAEQIAIAAIKYSILRSHTGNDIVYDLEQSLSFEGDSGPYLQYAHTRAVSILAKKDSNDVGENTSDTSNFEKILYRYVEVIAEASEKYEPHHVVTYLTELAGAFNSFYANTKIIDGENEAYNLALTKAFAQTMRNGLHVLGIKVPERM